MPGEPPPCISPTRKFSFNKSLDWSAPMTRSLRQVVVLLATVGAFTPAGAPAVRYSPQPQQQRASITGRVVDTQTGEPLVSVSVFLQGTRFGVLTSAEGR